MTAEQHFMAVTKVCILYVTQTVSMFSTLTCWVSLSWRLGIEMYLFYLLLSVPQINVEHRVGGCLCFDFGSSLFAVPAGGAILHKSYITYLRAEKGNFWGFLPATKYQLEEQLLSSGEESFNIQQEIYFPIFLSAISVWHTVPFWSSYILSKCIPQCTLNKYDAFRVLS